MEICDAHFHFNMKSVDPIQDMFCVVHKYHLKKVVLILNQECEFRMFAGNFTKLLGCGAELHLAVLMDIHNLPCFYQKVKWMNDHAIRYSIKLHPRLSNIQKIDFGRIDLALQKLEFENIIIDSFYYGCKLENLIYDELAVYLAQKYQTKKIVMAHFGGVNILRTMLCTRELPNIYYDISFTISYFSKTSIWMDIFSCISRNQDRVMYGSDYPGFSEEYSLKNIKNLFEQFEGPEDLFKKLLITNACGIYFKGEAEKDG